MTMTMTERSRSRSRSNTRMPYHFTCLTYTYLIYASLYINHATAHDWSTMAHLRLDNELKTPGYYSFTSTALYGRGFQTIISGYDPGNENGNQSIYIHTNDNGHAARGYVAWTLSSTLTLDDLQPSDKFGYSMAHIERTLAVGAPGKSLSRGFIYLFNGTSRYWTHTQTLKPEFDTTSEIYFGENIDIVGDTMAVSCRKCETEYTDPITKEVLIRKSSGKGYIFKRQTDGIHWSISQMLKADIPLDYQHLGEQMAFNGNW